MGWIVSSSQKKKKKKKDIEVLIPGASECDFRWW